MTDACGIQDPQRAVALLVPFLGIERVVGRATQRAIRLWDKLGAGKTVGEGGTRPVGRAIASVRRGRFRNLRRFLQGRFSLKGWSKFSAAQFCCREVLAQFQPEIPDPLRQDLAKLLAARRMGVPAIRVLFGVFIGQHGFKRPALQVEVKHI
jgi:hypothetical protein